MARKKMWVEWDDDGELTASKKKPGSYSPLTHGKNGVKSQVTLSDIDDDDAYSSDVDNDHPASDHQTSVLAEMAGAAVSGIAQALTAAWIEERRGRRAKEREALAAAEARSERERQEAQARARPTWHSDPRDPTLWRWWDGRAWTHHTAPKSGVQSPTPIQGARPSPSQANTTVAGGPAPSPKLTSSQWQQFLTAWAKSGTIPPAQWRALAGTRIIGADSHTLETQRRLQQLSAERASTEIRAMLGYSNFPRDEAALPIFLRTIGLDRLLLGSNEPRRTH